MSPCGGIISFAGQKVLVNLEIEGVPVVLEFSSHASLRLDEREVNAYEAASLVLKLGEEILDMKSGEEFGVIDRDLEIGLVCSVNVLDVDIFIDVITVLRGERIYFSRGMKVLGFKEAWGKIS